MGRGPAHRVRYMREVRMRFSLLASACTSAVMTAVFTLPLLAQPAPQKTQLTVMGVGKSRIELHCKDTQDLKQCVDGVQGLSQKEKKRLKALAPQLQKQLNEALSKAKDRSGTCFALRVYEFPKGFPENGANAQPKVSDCTSAALVKEKPVEAKKARAKGQ